MAVIDGFRSDLSITRKTGENFGNVSTCVLFSKVAYQRKRWYFVQNKIRCPSCISIVSLNRCSKPGTMSSLVKLFVKHITGLRSGEDTDVGGQHVDLSSPHTPIPWLSLYKAHATNEYS